MSPGSSATDLAALTPGLWTCRICRTSVLPGMYACCPNCSHERDWDDDAVDDGSLSPDRFLGQALYCCGMGWAEAVRFCGICGERPRTAAEVAARSPITELPEGFENIEVDDANVYSHTLVPFIALQWLLDEDEDDDQG